ncbi:hypothetical protein DDE74_14045 [Streptomyces lydicus]|uniref:Uncharacterized protein n=2 Tax=Streptomyces lydicus TaxID=47763 RepID=A0A3Q9K9N1_9ACTN|nr:hypothetical protein DDE74_14045 [Streptomyces lydicus]
MALAKGARITGGAFCLLFFLFTATWLVVDLSEFGIDGVWESWTFQNSGGINQVTSAFHFGLALVQLAAVFAAFAGQRVAGGLLAVATTLTFATALQAIVSVGSHTSDNRWFRHAETDTDTFDNVFLSSLGLFLLSLIAGIVLLAGMRSWPRQQPSDPPMRPARTAGVVAGLVLGAMVLVNLVWHVYMLVQGGSSAFTIFYLGKGSLGALLGLSTGWSALAFLALTVPAALNSLMRGAAARGLAIGLAVVSLPGALLSVIGMALNGTLFELSGPMPGMSIIGHLQLALDLFGSVVLLALMGRGEPVAPAWYPPSPSPQFGVPGFVPPPGPQAPPVWQPPAGPVPPVSGPPMPPAGAPPMPPGTPPPPQGGFGPPQY